MPKFTTLTVGKSYVTIGGTIVRIVTDLTDRFVGITGDAAAHNAFVFTPTGVSLNHGLISDLERVIDEGQVAFNKLGPYDQETVRRICTAFWDKKITGIKVLRGTFGLGLLEAKQIFEFVAA